MKLTTEHIKYYKQNKFSVKCPLFKAFDKQETFSIHKLINDQSDIVSLIRHNRNRPLDKDYKISNLYNLLRSINRRLGGEDLETYLEGLSVREVNIKRKAVLLRVLKKLKGSK